MIIQGEKIVRTVQLKHKLSKRERKNEIQFYLYISPWIIGFIIFLLYPFIYSLYLAFTNTQAITVGEFIGFENIYKMFQDDVFMLSIRNTFYYAFISVPLRVILSLGIAMLINQKLAGINVFRTLFYMPYVISGVAMTIVWGWIFNSTYGIFNNVLALFGIVGPNWLGDSKIVMNTFIIMSLWHTGSTIIIFLAGLQDVPTTLYESAKIDGAGKWKRFTHITVPLITPTIYFNVLLGFIGAFQMFMEPMILTDGGPVNGSETMVMQIYRNGFQYQNMGYASMLAWFLFIIIFIFMQIYNITSKKWVFYNN
jgi:multiple sugar transport system permease protein